MITRKSAVAAHGHALKAITELSVTLNSLNGNGTAAEYERVKKAVGLSIGKIQTDILDGMNANYPELDDLK